MKKFTSILMFIGCIGATADAQKVIPLYEGKAPGSETWTWNEAETQDPSNDKVIYNVTTPTLTAYLPHPLAANGTAVIIAPGGAFHILSMDNEGVEVAKWLNSKGIAAFVLKYRLGHLLTNDPFKELMAKMSNFKTLDETNATIVPLAMQDGLNAVKYVRSNAKSMNIDPNRIGFMGFSAGGTVTMSVVYNGTDENRPNFVAPIYAYEKAIIGSTVPKAKTPIYIGVASDDPLGFVPHSISIYNKWFEAKQPTELHIYEKGGHGFGMKKNNITTDAWTEQFALWLKMQGFMPPVPPPANPFQRAPTPNDTLVSVQVLSDKRVQFSLYAPEAKEVTVQGDFLKIYKPLKLNKNNVGVWSYTTEYALKPDFYAYNFYVDGLQLLDPKNPQSTPTLNGYSNRFEVDGIENNFQTWKHIPHGRMEVVNYPSQILGGVKRRLHVYLPPNYDKTKNKLPVLYLLHGGGDNDAGWSTIGRANDIMDNLYNEGKVKDMIIVMPFGHVPVPGLRMGAGVEQDPFCKELLQDIIPFIETKYRVSSKKEHRAIAGLSMGGIQTLNLALWNPDKFSYVYPMSTGYFPLIIKELEEKHSAILKNPAINQFQLFTIGMGKDDGLAYGNNQAMMDLFKKMSIKFNYVETEGGHTYLVWRKNLAYIAPLLFK
jgi:enterochelin esterase-like enzyme/acetyl esterase/lipase